jgi:hypothetical protein
MLAMSLWLCSRGRPGLRALPRPARALAVITAGDWCYFLAAAGGCPGSGGEPAPAAGAPGDGAAGPGLIAPGVVSCPRWRPGHHSFGALGAPHVCGAGGKG